MPNATNHTWRDDACQIVEQLFAVTSSREWDGLIDLRQALLRGEDWGHTLDLFLVSREKLEDDHYLPFYRLRNLIAVSLRLEAIGTGEQPACLSELLKGHHKCFADLKKRVRREWFEHQTDVTHKLELRVVEAV